MRLSVLTLSLVLTLGACTDSALLGGDLYGGDGKADGVSLGDMRGGFIPVASPPTAYNTTGPRRRIIYLNRFGGTFQGGAWDDAGKNVSSVIYYHGLASAQVSAFQYGMTQWQEVVGCVKTVFEPFDVEITEEDPGDVDHVEAVVGGWPGEIGEGPGTAGIAPFATSDCRVIERGVTYTFANALSRMDSVCAVIAQETGHALGLDHEMLCSDPMTYLTACGQRTFQNTEAPCGEYSERACSCGGTSQNSYAHLMGVFGEANVDPDPPAVEILDPMTGATLSASAPVDVNVDASDNVEVTSIDLFVDEGLVQTDSSAPWEFSLDLPVGRHTVEVHARDESGNIGVDSVSFEIASQTPTPPTEPPPGGGTDGDPDDDTGEPTVPPTTVPPGGGTVEPPGGVEPDPTLTGGTGSGSDDDFLVALGCQASPGAASGSSRGGLAALGLLYAIGLAGWLCRKRVAR